MHQLWVIHLIYRSDFWLLKNSSHFQGSKKRLFRFIEHQIGVILVQVKLSLIIVSLQPSLLLLRNAKERVKSLLQWRLSCWEAEVFGLPATVIALPPVALFY